VRMGASRAEGLDGVCNLQLAGHLCLSRLVCLGKFHLIASASIMMPRIITDIKPSDCAPKPPSPTSGCGRTAPDESVLSEAEVSEDVCEGTAIDSASNALDFILRTVLLIWRTSLVSARSTTHLVSPIPKIEARREK